jgi:retron-type reverse transcriptase
MEEGTPQGGPLSPLLSNIVLDELDWELDRRGHRFVRYADDANIFVQSERAGQRVMAKFSPTGQQEDGEHDPAVRARRGRG